jgi:hypothetical protein
MLKQLIYRSSVRHLQLIGDDDVMRAAVAHASNVNPYTAQAALDLLADAAVYVAGH